MPNLPMNRLLHQATYHRSILSMSNGTSKIINSLRHLPRSVSSRMPSSPSRLRSWPKLRPMLSPRIAPRLAPAALPHLPVQARPLKATTMLKSELRSRMNTIMALLRSMPRSREKRLFSLSLNLKSTQSLRKANRALHHHLLRATVQARPLKATTMLRLEPRTMTHTTTSKTLPRSMLRLRLRLSKPSKKRPSSTLPTS